jgi:prepilin-type N-terminal cleavage/methylation domain-containing protein/prepilin-type processing-associated H-X9-DG protein
MSQFRRSSGPSATGFTLLELLVVIGIISVLVTLLSATVGRINDRAKVVTCASNERQLFLACLNYGYAYDNFLPCPSLIGESPTTTIGPQVCWAMDQTSVADLAIGTLWPYLSELQSARKEAIMCPSDTTGYSRVGGLVVGSRNFSYSFNINIRPNLATSATLKLQQIAQPTKRVMIYEEFAPNDGACFGPGDSDDWLTGRHGGTNTESLTNYQSTAYTNTGRGNVCYFDGHIELMTVNYYFTNQSHFSPLLN